MWLKHSDQCVTAQPSWHCYPLSLYRDLALGCQTVLIITCCLRSPIHLSFIQKYTAILNLLHLHITSWQLFFASSVNVRSKVHFEIMEHVTFFSVSRRYCSWGIGAFWMRGCTEAGGAAKPWGKRRNVTITTGARSGMDINFYPCVLRGKKKEKGNSKEF